MWVLVVARAVQGFGAGLNIVSLYVVVGRAFPAGLRPRVFSAISSGWILPSLVGPPVAGLLADHLSWRWVFLGVLPLLLGAALLVRPHLRGLDGPAADAAAGRAAAQPARRRGAGRGRRRAAAARRPAAQRAPRAGGRCWSWPGSCCSGSACRGCSRAGAFRLGARPADGRGPARRAGRRLLRRRDVHPADARRAAVAGHDPGRRLAHRRGADLVARRLAAGPARAADPALRCW